VVWRKGWHWLGVRIDAGRLMAAATQEENWQDQDTGSLRFSPNHDYDQCS
jgi:hypothetical protein